MKQNMYKSYTCILTGISWSPSVFTARAAWSSSHLLSVEKQKDYFMRFKTHFPTHTFPISDNLAIKEIVLHILCI